MSQTTVRKKESWFPENVSHYLLQYKHSNGLAFGNQTQQLKINHLDHLVRCFFQSKHLRILFGDYVQLAMFEYQGVTYINHLCAMASVAIPNNQRVWIHHSFTHQDAIKISHHAPIPISIPSKNPPFLGVYPIEPPFFEFSLL